MLGQIGTTSLLLTAMCFFGCGRREIKPRSHPEEVSAGANKKTGKLIYIVFWGKGPVARGQDVTVADVVVGRTLDPMLREGKAVVPVALNQAAEPKDILPCTFFTAVFNPDKKGKRIVVRGKSPLPEDSSRICIENGYAGGLQEGVRTVQEVRGFAIEARRLINEVVR